MESANEANQMVLLNPLQNQDGTEPEVREPRSTPTPESESAHAKRSRRALKEKFRRKIKKKYESRRFLQRRKLNRDTLLKRHPHIGQRIESIVRDSGVGADKWRSSSSLTWERRRVGQKITFPKIRHTA